MYKLTEEQKIETLNAMADYSMNIKDVANALFTHRNTIKYRINKIKDETGLDARKFRDLVKLLDGIKGEEI